MGLHDVPHLFRCAAELATRNASTERIVANGYLLVYNGVREVVLATCHCANEHRNGMCARERGKVLRESNCLRVARQCDFIRVHGEVIRDRVLNDLEKLLGAVDASNEEFVEKLNHEAAESLESSGYTNMRVDFDQHAFRGVYVDL